MFDKNGKKLHIGDDVMFHGATPEYISGKIIGIGHEVAIIMRDGVEWKRFSQDIKKTS